MRTLACLTNIFSPSYRVLTDPDCDEAGHKQPHVSLRRNQPAGEHHSTRGGNYAGRPGTHQYFPLLHRRRETHDVADHRLLPRAGVRRFLEQVRQGRRYVVDGKRREGMSRIDEGR